ncbi:MAG: hypothetical protein AB8B77_03590 [Alphaproteobacteria bacterium]
MSLTQLEIVNRALIKIGAAPLNTLSEPKAEAKVAQLLFGTKYDSMLSSYGWSFATLQRPLIRLISRPITDYKYAYQLPKDFLRVLSAGNSDRSNGLDYRILEKRLHCDSDHVILTYVFRPKETNLPPYFTQALIAALAAEFCLPIVESVSRMEALMKLADYELRQARQVDATQDTPQNFQDFTLIEARG